MMVNPAANAGVAKAKQDQRTGDRRRPPLLHGHQRLTLAVALSGIFLVVGMRATLLAHSLAAALPGKGHALGGYGGWSALAVGFSNDFVSHGNLSSLVKLAIVTHLPGILLAVGSRWILAGFFGVTPPAKKSGSATKGEGHAT